MMWLDRPNAANSGRGAGHNLHYIYHPHIEGPPFRGLSTHVRADGEDKADILPRRPLRASQRDLERLKNVLEGRGIAFASSEGRRRSDGVKAVEGKKGGVYDAPRTFEGAKGTP